MPTEGLPDLGAADAAATGVMTVYATTSRETASSTKRAPSRRHILALPPLGDTQGALTQKYSCTPALYAVYFAGTWISRKSSLWQSSDWQCIADGSFSNIFLGNY
jgi:hypothetical protein